MYNYFLSFIIFTCTTLTAFTPTQRLVQIADDATIDRLTRQTYALRRDIATCSPLTKPALSVLQKVLTTLNSPTLSSQDLLAIQLHIRRFKKLAPLCTQKPCPQREVAAVTALIARRAALVSKLNRIKSDYLFTCVVGNNLPQLLDRTLTHEEDIAYFNEQQQLIESYKNEMDAILEDLTTIETFLLADTRTWWEKFQPLIVRVAGTLAGVFIAGSAVNAFHSWQKKC